MKYGAARQKCGSPQRRFKDVVKEDMQRTDVTLEDAVDRVRRRRMICCGEP